MKKLAVFAVVLLACGGDAVTDFNTGGGGSAGSGATSGTAGSGTTTNSGSTGGSGGTGGAGGMTTSTASMTTTTGPGPCDDHNDCGDDGVCIFGIGQCAPACGAGLCDGCGSGSICNDCATSSCPACADCVAACVPIAPDQCDVDDPCPNDGTVCHWGLAQCFEPCGVAGCPDPNMICAGCATGSCCGCDDCVDLCMPL